MVRITCGRYSGKLVRLHVDLLGLVYGTRRDSHRGWDSIELAGTHPGTHSQTPGGNTAGNTAHFEFGNTPEHISWTGGNGSPPVGGNTFPVPGFEEDSGKEADICAICGTEIFGYAEDGRGRCREHFLAVPV